MAFDSKYFLLVRLPVSSGTIKIPSVYIVLRPSREFSLTRRRHRGSSALIGHRVSASSSSCHTLCDRRHFSWVRVGENCFELPFDFFHSYGSVIIVGYLSRSTDLNRTSLVLVVSSEDPEIILIQVPTEKKITSKRGVSSLHSMLVGRSVSIQFPYTFRLP